MEQDKDFFLMNRKAPNVFADVAKFTEVAQPDMLVEKGQRPKEKAIQLAIALIEEEYGREYLPALLKYKAEPTIENLTEVVDGAMDCIYVIAWAMRVFNVPAEACWNEVQRSNMAKFPDFDPYDANCKEPTPHESHEGIGFICEVNTSYQKIVIRNATTGKVMKPAGWTPPDIAQVLAQDALIHSLVRRPDIIADRFLRNYFYESERRIKENGSSS